jgi:hypothetical protein
MSEFSLYTTCDRKVPAIRAINDSGDNAEIGLRGLRNSFGLQIFTNEAVLALSHADPPNKTKSLKSRRRQGRAHVRLESDNLWTQAIVRLARLAKLAEESIAGVLRDLGGPPNARAILA